MQKGAFGTVRSECETNVTQLHLMGLLRAGSWWFWCQGLLCNRLFGAMLIVLQDSMVQLSSILLYCCVYAW